MGSDGDWKLVTDYGVAEYACGLKAGERVALKKAIVIREYDGKATGQVLPAGEIWTVLSGAKSDPGTVWFRQADGKPHTWDDIPEYIDEWFERLGPK